MKGSELYSAEFIEKWATYPQCDHSLTVFYSYSISYLGERLINYHLKEAFVDFLDHNYGRIKTTIDDGDFVKMVGFRSEEEALPFLLATSHLKRPVRISEDNEYYWHMKYSTFWWTNDAFCTRMCQLREYVNR